MKCRGKHHKCSNITQIKRRYIDLHQQLLKCGFQLNELKESNKSNSTLNATYFWGLPIVLVLCALYYLLDIAIIYLQGVRCIIPNNYFIWEATRPISNCHFCTNVTNPLVLPNLTQTDFQQYAYSSQPIVLKQACTHWPAMREFNFQYFKNLYESYDDSYKSVDEECQFLHFHSDFISLRDVFSMKEARVENKPGEKSWYIGWGNCHPQILREMRSHYPKPHFLPADCEIPSKEYVFMGYGAGATVHLDFISRLMWQVQLRGSKTWFLLPPPECEDVCESVTFEVEPGDAVLVDTRVWYHGTTITSGEFSLSVQSEYG